MSARDAYTVMRDTVNAAFAHRRPGALRHFHATVSWVLALRPVADRALLAATVGHDLERSSALRTRAGTAGCSTRTSSPSVRARAVDAACGVHHARVVLTGGDGGHVRDAADRHRRAADGSGPVPQLPVAVVAAGVGAAVEPRSPLRTPLPPHSSSAFRRPRDCRRVLVGFDVDVRMVDGGGFDAVQPSRQVPVAHPSLGLRARPPHAQHFAVRGPGDCVYGGEGAGVGRRR